MGTHPLLCGRIALCGRNDHLVGFVQATGIVERGNHFLHVVALSALGH